MRVVHIHANGTLEVTDSDRRSRFVFGDLPLKSIECGLRSTLSSRESDFRIKAAHLEYFSFERVHRGEDVRRRGGRGGAGGTSARAACVVTVRIRGRGRGRYGEVIAEAVGELHEGVGGAGATRTTSARRRCSMWRIGWPRRMTPGEGCESKVGGRRGRETYRQLVVVGSCAFDGGGCRKMRGRVW